MTFETPFILDTSDKAVQANSLLKLDLKLKSILKRDSSSIQGDSLLQGDLSIDVDYFIINHSNLLFNLIHDHSIIPSILDNILEYCKQLDLHHSIANVISKTIIKSHLPILFRYISGTDIQLIQSSLQLILSIASYNPLHLKDLQDNFNFGMKSLSQLFKYRKKIIYSDSKQRLNTPNGIPY